LRGEIQKGLDSGSAKDADGRDKVFPNTTPKELADKIRKFLGRKLTASPVKSAA
jgi:hypothetical protein